MIRDRTCQGHYQLEITLCAREYGGFRCRESLLAEQQHSRLKDRTMIVQSESESSGDSVEKNVKETQFNDITQD